MNRHTNYGRNFIAQMDNFQDVVRVFKHLVHIQYGRRKEAMSELRQIENYFDLPEWDDVPDLDKIKVYEEGWRQLIEEGYDN